MRNSVVNYYDTYKLYRNKRFCNHNYSHYNCFKQSNVVHFSSNQNTLLNPIVMRITLNGGISSLKPSSLKVSSALLRTEVSHHQCKIHGLQHLPGHAHHAHSECWVAFCFSLLYMLSIALSVVKVGPRRIQFANGAAYIELQGFGRGGGEIFTLYGRSGIGGYPNAKQFWHLHHVF